MLEEGAEPVFLSNVSKVPVPLETAHKNVNSELRKTLISPKQVGESNEVNFKRGMPRLRERLLNMSSETCQVLVSTYLINGLIYTK